MKGIIFENPIFICAGESSGDLYAGCLAGQLKDNVPRPVIYGVGGEEMKKNGVEVLIDYQGLMTFGFSSGFFSFLRNCLVYKEIRKKLFQMRPKTFIAVAYPGINILLCRSAKKLGCRVYYFLPPQIWAWGGFRKYFIKKWVDTVISVFPFEYKFYKKTGIETRFWENPLWKKLTGYKRTDFRKRIGFMPGSRSSEIKRNMPVVLDLMDKIRQKNRDAEFCLVMHEDFISKAWRNLFGHSIARGGDYGCTADLFQSSVIHRLSSFPKVPKDWGV
jgi:lipid-A-disaccharide synthase